MSHYRELQRIEEQLLSQLSDVRRSIRKIEMDALDRETGCAVGKRIKYCGEEYEISRFRGSSVLSVYGYKIKKNNEPSKREVFINCVSVPKID